MGNPLCHFEFMVGDDAKARKFYGDVFDWSFESMPGPMEYTMIKTGSAPGGGLMKKPDEAPQPALNVYFLVESVDATLEKVAKAGGRILMGKTPIPEIGAWGMFLDPDGIPVGIFEETGN